MRLLSHSWMSRTILLIGGVFLFLGLSNSSPTGSTLALRAESETTQNICFWDRPQSKLFFCFLFLSFESLCDVLEYRLWDGMEYR
jgi:hypothetical protein